MSWIQWLILTSACAVLLLVASKVAGRKWGLGESADVLTIYGVAVATILVFQYSPQLVKLLPEEDLRLSGLHADQWVSFWDANGPSVPGSELHRRLTKLPLGRFQLYVHNSGNAVATDLALEFWNAGLSHTPFSSWRAYLFSDPRAGIPPARSLDWSTGGNGNIEVHSCEDWRRIYLPPIKPGGTVGVMVGLVYGVVYDEKRFSEGVRRGELSVRLVRTTPPVFDNHLHYVPKEPNVLLTARTPWGVAPGINED